MEARNDPLSQRDLGQVRKSRPPRLKPASLLSAFSGASEEAIQSAWEQLVRTVGGGSTVLVINVVLHMALIAYWLIAMGLAL